MGEVIPLFIKQHRCQWLELPCFNEHTWSHDVANCALKKKEGIPMHDINGKALHIGSEIHTYAYGMLLIKDMKEEHDPDKGGALIECIGVGRGGQSIELRTHEHKVTKVRTWKELAELALQVQDASNLSGVVRSFADILTEVRARLDAEGKGGNDNIHAHPVCVLFSSKIASLTSSESPTLFSQAYTWASDMKEGKVR